MTRTLITAAAAFSIFWAGSAISSGASAGGGAAFTVTKSKPPVVTSAGRTKGTEITEFSSSSARRHRPNR